MAALPARAVILSFEGPDPYSLVGGLGSRVTELAHALGAAGTSTDLIFIGDPQRPALEDAAPNVRYRRWGQWLSAIHAAGVYDGEPAKIHDFMSSIPPFLAGEPILQAAVAGEHVLILAEDWQTAPAVIALEALLRERGLQHAATICWNANNTYGFETIDWNALQRACTITAVSKYMKFELAQRGIPALVIPNGVPARLLRGPDPADSRALRSALHGRPLLAKVGRFDPDKRWMQAIEAVAVLRAHGKNPQLVVRGGKEPYGEVVLGRASELGLRIEDVAFASNDIAGLCKALSSASAEIINLRSFLPEPLLTALYNAADAVLANSGKEPFGLVGLEVMAAGGLPVCGSTGEDYAEPFVNAIVCDTADPRELAAYLESVTGDEQAVADMKRAAHETAARFTWPIVLEGLARKVQFIEAAREPGSHAGR